ncbi:hypothetical protein GUITHDRAFT_115303 [Guillardia theta CCMP2712]|uniref:Uncharacterized protein n=1 Tax=Guillardia theta (strain CCMP2712) TaxID=905079 RepID=L1IR06_GUITC|nr:hypothetical protein GUITHDRAFT_115303 [Guillardia theta CCMP2712]EKX38527.1 hypothetical protein GUITHDRAFT_115303 [Guillardia theta CCMP2712]|eukprot:XP_005825507.1 hypothetical protein GUITHDRAFT_115303 [Guillardia theta CCMP2712]
MASAHMEAVSKGTPEHGTSGVKDIEDVTSRLHDVAFEVLSSNRADGDSVNAIRSTLTSYLEFSEHHTGREVVSDRSSWDHKQKKEELRHILSQRAPIDVFFEISRLLDGMRRREYVAAQLRAKILKRHKFLSETTSDQLYHLDIKEMDLKRRVEERDFGVSSARIDSQEDLLIKKVAVSMDPVTNLVLQIALGEGGSDRVVVLSSLQESLKLATAVPKQKDVSEAELHILTDRAKALVTLCENLREEYLDRMKQNGRSPRLEQLFAKQRKQYEFRNLLQKYGSASSNLTAILQSRVCLSFLPDSLVDALYIKIRSTLYIRSKSARVLQRSIRCCACRLHFVGMAGACKLLQAVTKRCLAPAPGGMDVQSVSSMSSRSLRSGVTAGDGEIREEGDDSIGIGMLSGSHGDLSEAIRRIQAFERKVKQADRSQEKKLRDELQSLKGGSDQQTAGVNSSNVTSLDDVTRLFNALEVQIVNIMRAFV